jgi:hypothetical protein
LDQIIIFQRLVDKNLIQGTLENWMLPCLAVACMAIPTLRTRPNIVLMAVLLGLSLFLISGSGLVPWLVMPLQALGIFWVLVSGLEACGFKALRGRETDAKSCSVSVERERHVDVVEMKLRKMES